MQPLPYLGAVPLVEGPQYFPLSRFPLRTLHVQSCQLEQRCRVERSCHPAITREPEFAFDAQQWRDPKRYRMIPHTPVSP